MIELLWENFWNFPSEMKHKPTLWPAMTLLRNMKAHIHTKTQVRFFLAAFFTIAKTQGRARHASMGKGTRWNGTRKPRKEHWSI